GGTDLVNATRADPAPLRIAVSLQTVLPTKPTAEIRAAIAATVELLQALGHSTAERDPDYGALVPLFVPRYLRGGFEDATRLGGPAGLEPRARSTARLARRALAGEKERAARINRVFEHADVLLTPVTAAPAPRLGQGHHRSGV